MYLNLNCVENSLFREPFSMLQLDGEGQENRPLKNLIFSRGHKNKEDMGFIININKKDHALKKVILHNTDSRSNLLEAAMGHVQYLGEDGHLRTSHLFGPCTCYVRAYEILVMKVLSLGGCYFKLEIYWKIISSDDNNIIVGREILLATE